MPPLRGSTRMRRFPKGLRPWLNYAAAPRLCSYQGQRHRIAHGYLRPELELTAADSWLAILALLAVYEEILLRFARKMVDGAVDILAVLVGTLGPRAKQSRRSLDGSAFPGRAWERGCRRSSAAVSFVRGARRYSAASLTPGPSPGGSGEIRNWGRGGGALLGLLLIS